LLKLSFKDASLLLEACFQPVGSVTCRRLPSSASILVVANLKG